MVNLERRVFVVVVVELLFFLCAEVTCQQNVTLRSGIERRALLQLRSSLGLRGKDWPIKSDPCLFWIGVKCLNGSVTGLNISGLRRTRLGKLNPQFAVDGLANLTKLESFNSSGFLLPGSIPALFGSDLGSLRVLDLSSCAVSGIIPSSLGNLSSLESLYLSNNNLTGAIPSSLGQLLSLSVLDVSKNTLTGSIPLSFSTLGSLSILDMSSNFLSGFIPAQLGNLATLTDLDLSLNSLSGTLPPELSGMTNLQRLVISNNTLSGSVPNNVLANMSQLQYLDLHQNDFSGTLPDIVWSMSGLHFLDVSGNNFTGSLPVLNFISNATDIVFNLSKNTFYGNLTSVLTGFKVIDLSENYFEGKVQIDVLGNASLDRNCLQTVPNQRTLAECVSFYTEKGLIFDNFGAPVAPEPTPAKSSESGNRRRTIILASVLGGLGLIILLALVFVVLLFCVCRRGGSTQRGNGVGPVPTGNNLPTPGVSLDLSSLGEAFTYQQLLLATGEFDESNLIKHGHSGDLFKGILEGGISIVVKRIDLQTVKKEEYLLELEFFSKASHTRLVPLLGHCVENENEKFLVYKFMPNRDLSSSLFRKANSEDDSLQSLDWITRLKIATGAAEGLSYLHHECNPPLVHRDVQASSILLDDKFEVRLGSLSEVCVQEGDTHQNRITRLLRLPQTSEQASTGPTTANCAYDVYCFGKVLLELVTGKLGISSSSDTAWIEQIVPHISIYDKELVTKIVDPTLIIDDDLLEEVWAMAVVARSCLNPKPSRRPLMRYILKALENPLKVVREESSSSMRLKETSSRGSWNAALFGSWRHSSLDTVAVPTTSAQRQETASSLKQSGTSGSQGSGKNSQGGNSSSRRRQSNEIYPEPSYVQDVERQADG